MSYYMLLGKNSLDDSLFFSCPSVYSGHQSILIPPLELESSLPVWLSTLSQYKIRDTFCSYSVMELCTKGLGTQTEILKVRLGLHSRQFHCIWILFYCIFCPDSDDSDYSSDYGTPIIVYSLVMAVSLADMSSFKS